MTLPLENIESKPLPKIDVPTYTVKVPSTGKKVKVRPFSVKEEKLLFMALESKNIEDIINTVKQVINNCVVTGEVNVDKLPFFDIDYIFIFLRAKSVGETVEIRMTCNNVLDTGNVCNHTFKSNMDIANVDMVKNDEIKNDIRLDKDKGVIMKYPNYSVIKHIEDNDKVDKKTALITSSIDYIYDKKGQYSSKDYTKDQLKEFVEGLTEENYGKLEGFVDNFPAFVAKIDAKCPKCGFEHHVRYSDFYDFFY